MTKCVKPLRQLVRLSAESSRSTNQNAPLGRLALLVAKCLSGYTHVSWHVFTLVRQQREIKRKVTCRGMEPNLVLHGFEVTAAVHVPHLLKVLLHPGADSRSLFASM